MTDGFTCTDKETLVAYVYGECEAAERLLVEAHLHACHACAEEVEGLGSVRAALRAWTVPARAVDVRGAPDAGAGQGGRVDGALVKASPAVLRPARWWQRPLPALGRLAAGILLFAGGAAIANLEVRYDQDGFAVRTGWARQAPEPSPAGVAVRAPADVPGAAASGAAMPWRADLVSLEQRLRQEIVREDGAARTAPLGTPAPVLDDRALVARVSEMIAASEQRQERAMAYRMSEMFGELSAQRQNDLLRVQQGLGQLEGTTGAEVMRQRQLLNYLLTVSERR
ncbi:MAG TPA: zf-HC2 domain-containing protein [Vicinamibacterales bacterium]|nr:zf-HC2 domain-containing protein [Vicinamibacterales bacterium]